MTRRTYRTCFGCGASLDPSEVCDCRNVEAALDELTRHITTRGLTLGEWRKKLKALHIALELVKENDASPGATDETSRAEAQRNQPHSSTLGAALSTEGRHI